MLIGIGIGLPFNKQQYGVPVTSSVLSILQKYGTDAHLWIPGIGAVNGVNTYNWQDSAGTQPAVFNQPVGKANDVGGGSVSATQMFDIPRPVIKQDEASKSYWSFDGNSQHLKLDTPLFQLTDDFVVIAGVSLTETGSSKTIFGQSNDSNHALPLFLFNGTGKLGVYVLGGGATLGSYGTDNNAGQGPLVASMVAKAGVIAARRNSAEVSSVTLSGDYLIPTRASLAAYPTLSPSQTLNGSLYPVIGIKGLVSDDDLLVLEKWVGECSGVVI